MEKLKKYQVLFCALIGKYTVNDEQTFAFLIVADNHGRELINPQPQLHLMIAGPGGARKSQVFDAFGEFYFMLEHAYQLKITAPTALSANNVGGSTTHSKSSLRVKRKALHADGHQDEMLCSNLEEHFQGITIMITDEIYFLGASDIGLLSENLKIARHIISSVFGNLNVIFAGDAAQLPPSKAVSLFDHTLLQCYESNDMNGLN